MTGPPPHRPALATATAPGINSPAMADDKPLRPLPERPLPERPLPVADAITAGFWDGAREGELRIQRCRRCERWQHPPAIACRSCGGGDLGFAAIPGELTLYSWAVLQDAPAPGFRDRLPLILGVVEARAQQGILIAANLVGVKEADLRLGLRLAPSFEPVDDDTVLVQFTPVEDQ